MSTGAPGSDYETLGQRYRAILKRSGIDLQLRPSAGAVENLERLNDPRSGVAIAFVQGGLTSEARSPALESLGAMFFQPLWFFSRLPPDARLDALRGKRLAVGPEGSGTRVLSLQLLALNNIDPSFAQFLPLSTQAAGAGLLHGDIEAATMVSSWESDTVRRLLASPELNAVSFPRADAYVALYPYLTKLRVPMGVGDLATNRPPSDVSLVAPKASLIVRRDLHPALKNLLLEAATEIHSAPGIFARAGQFPAAEPGDLPLSRDAQQFYKSGPPFLQRYLPFWLATFTSRLLVLLIPVMGVAYPLLRFAPAFYGWSMRRRVYRLYGELKFIEAEIESTRGHVAADVDVRLQRLQERANRLQVPVSFASLLYQLRTHIQLVRQQAAEPAART
ncbi:MAG TPA: TAXI family TRAP transporter solute-binding subunit [Steroidobacteraceae bacterium]|jgi:TRAP-type uncharacterized transport system substrate-binding protein|nr:TAXI family TRAP transporter solute-binding subunit [Steroidobacteraceae bacterium]